jgi:hypothetical protein
VCELWDLRIVQTSGEVTMLSRKLQRTINYKEVTVNISSEEVEKFRELQNISSCPAY